jgi:hypothetical protein
MMSAEEEEEEGKRGERQAKPMTNTVANAELRCKEKFE